MTKIRVYELAKELDMESKDVIRRLGKMGADVKNHMSTVENQYADMLRDIMRPRLILAEQNRLATEKAQAQAKAPTQLKTKVSSKPLPESAKEASRETPKESAEKAKTVSDAAETATPAAAASAPKETATKQEKATVSAPSPVHQTSAEVEKPAVSKTSETVQAAAKPVATTEAKPVPRQQGVFAHPPKSSHPQARQQGVFARPPQSSHPQARQQGVFARPQGDNRGPRQQNGRNNRDGQNRSQGDYNRDGRNRPQGSDYSRRVQNHPGQGASRSQGGYNNRSQSSIPPGGGDVISRPQEKKDPRRFDQKKKQTFDSRKNRDGDNRRFDNAGYRQSCRRPPQKNKKNRPHKEEMPVVVPKTVVIGDTVIISELAKSMCKTAAEVIKKLMSLGIMATVNQEIDAETATILASEFGITVEVKVDRAMEMMIDDESEDVNMVERPPVVTVMGHVDHGKTSLLDAIRETNVISTEAGGITQHIGAYQVEINHRKITFLDTPGHEAFTSMRARGAQVTDIAVLVVAADDGVMPQTVEAINHAKAADVPIIVTINKIDKPGADVDKIRQKLTEYGLVDEEWGGNTIMVPVSAKKREGIENLLEMILLVADVAELKSDPNRHARGTIIEAQLDKGRGAVATVLVQKGTLHIGDIIVAGTEFAKIRAMVDEKGRRVKQALPSTPVEVLGFSDVPPPGEIFVCVDDEKDARHIATHNAILQREKEINKSSKVSLDDLFKQISAGEVKDLNIVVKADVQGSIEALCQSIENLSNDEVHVNIIHSGVGAVAESDVMLAAASNALIIGFNVRPNANTKKAAEREGVDIRMYRVIYEALDDIKAAMCGLLDPEFKEVIVGQVEVRDVIKVPKVGLIAGSYVIDGKVVRNGKARVLRNGIVVHEGDIASLRRFKDDVKEVQEGFECGIGLENFNDIKVDDQIEIYIMEETKREI